MPLFKELKLLKKKLEVLERKNPNGWMGKWVKSLTLKSLRAEIKDVENEIQQRKNKSYKNTEHK